MIKTSCNVSCNQSFGARIRVASPLDGVSNYVPLSVSRRKGLIRLATDLLRVALGVKMDKMHEDMEI